LNPFSDQKLTTIGVFDYSVGQWSVLVVFLWAYFNGIGRNYWQKKLIQLCYVRYSISCNYFALTVI